MRHLTPKYFNKPCLLTRTFSHVISTAWESASEITLISSLICGLCLMVPFVFKISFNLNSEGEHLQTIFFLSLQIFIYPQEVVLTYWNLLLIRVYPIILLDFHFTCAQQYTVFGMCLSNVFICFAFLFSSILLLPNLMVYPSVLHSDLGGYCMKDRGYLYYHLNKPASTFECIQ